MKCRGYTGTISFSKEDGLFHGKIKGISDLVSFEGANLDQLEADFRSAVDAYLETCQETGKKPDRTYSGRVSLHLGKELHRSVAILADAEGSSLNSWIAARLQELAKGGSQGVA